MNPEYISNGLIFPIMEHGKEEMYITDAAIEVISSIFFESENIEEMQSLMKEKGYRLIKYRSVVSLNFDER